MTEARKGYVLPVDPLNELGDPETIFRNTGQLQFIRTLISTLKDIFQTCVKRDQPTPYFHLSAPSGVVFRVSVTDAGALVVENARARQIT